jgi:hypothetical protein
LKGIWLLPDSTTLPCASALACDDGQEPCDTDFDTEACHDTAQVQISQGFRLTVIMSLLAQTVQFSSEMDVSRCIEGVTTLTAS